MLSSKHILEKNEIIGFISHFLVSRYSFMISEVNTQVNEK